VGLGAEGARRLSGGGGAEDLVAGVLEGGGGGVEGGGLARPGDPDHHRDRSPGSAQLLDQLALPRGELVPTVGFGPFDRRRDLRDRQCGPGLIGEIVDGAGDGGLGCKDFGGGVGLLAGAGHPD
jgi:hypothetical protein